MIRRNLSRTAISVLVTCSLTGLALSSSAASAAQAARRDHVLRVRPGLDMLVLSKRDKPLYGQGGLSLPVLSGDGEHVAWVYDNDHGNDFGDYGLMWRDLASGRTLQLRGTYAYGLDMSAGGRYVVYSKAAEIESPAMSRAWPYGCGTPRPGSKG
jgi:hypothetical protein